MVFLHATRFKEAHEIETEQEIVFMLFNDAATACETIDMS
jgi:hypothetical protein